MVWACGTKFSKNYVSRKIETIEIGVKINSGRLLFEVNIEESKKGSLEYKVVDNCKIIPTPSS